MEILKKLFFLLAVIVIESRSQMPPLCRHGDSGCIAFLCNTFFAMSADGVPEFGLVRTNPYQITNVTVEKGGPSLIRIHFERANITGIHNFHIEKVIGFDKDPRTSKFEVMGTVKRSTVRGPYEISGRFSLLPISGQGHADIVMENVKMHVKFVTGVKTKNGKNYIVLKKAIVTITPEKFRVHFEKLFGNKKLSDKMNAAINKKSDIFYKELAPSIETIIGDAIIKIYSPVSKIIAYDDVFIKDD